MEKIKKKIKELVENSEVKFYNGTQIKRVSFGDWNMKVFQLDGKKYKFGIEISEKCNNQTKFIPQSYEFQLIDYRNGRVYSGIEKMSQFLELSTEDLQELLLPMIKKSKFTKEEIEKSIEDYRNFVIHFRKDFIGIDDNSDAIKFIQTTDIQNIL